MLILSFHLVAIAQEDPSQEIEGASQDALFKKAAADYSQGKYQATADELDLIEQKLLKQNKPNKAHLGLINYWKGISYSRLQHFPNAIKSFQTALKYDYSPLDLNYEYGQALFASEKLSEARLQFRESLKKKFKRAVSLYYIAYISKEMGEKKKAVTFYKSIEKLGEEGKEVRQAAEMQIGDIYLEQVENHPDAFSSVERYVIPKYQQAYEVDKDSALASAIKEKIVALQQKYNLILFRLRNGRPTLNPPYFLRIAEEIGKDSNVTFAPTETTISKSKQGSGFSKTDFMGRYTVYHKDFLSLSPELRFNYTRYFNRIPEIYKNDNYLIAPALRTAYEYTIWDKPAATLVDVDYNYAERDIQAKKDLQFASRVQTFMIGEKFNYFAAGETIVRLRLRNFESYIDTNDSKSMSFVFEQVKSFSANLLLFYFSYDRVRVDNDAFDSNAMTFRTDLIMEPYKGTTPSLALSITSTDPINNSDRGRELLINPSGRLTRSFSKNWRGNLKLDYQKNKSNDTENFAYKKTTYSFELEYIY